MSEAIKKNKIVGLHYKLHGEDKAVLDSSEGQEPLLYMHGHEQIVIGLERALDGKKIGEKLSVDVAPEDGYGQYDPKLTNLVEKKQFPANAKFEVGALYEFTNSKGQPLVVQITEVNKDTVKVDANHPLAGKKLHFDVEVVSIRDATKEELEHGHAHGEGGHKH